MQSDLYTDCICSLSAWMMEWFLIFFVEEKMDILDQTETNLVAQRRTVYFTIQSIKVFFTLANSRELKIWRRARL